MLARTGASLPGAHRRSSPAHRAITSCNTGRRHLTSSNHLGVSFKRLPHSVAPRPGITCHGLWPSANSTEAEAPISVQTITTALLRAQNAWEQYDKGKKGELALLEVVALLNSDEVRHAIRLIANVEPMQYTEALVQEAFAQADKDRSGRLSRTEFLALYLALASKRVKANPLLLAEALLGAIDADRNGTIEGNELRMMLTLLGFPAALILPIPPFFKVEYRSILKALSPPTM